MRRVLFTVFTIFSVFVFVLFFSLSASRLLREPLQFRSAARSYGEGRAFSCGEVKRFLPHWRENKRGLEDACLLRIGPLMQ